MNKHRSVVLDEEINEKLGKRAYFEGVSISKLLRAAVSFYLNTDPYILKMAQSRQNRIDKAYKIAGIEDPLDATKFDAVTLETMTARLEERLELFGRHNWTEKEINKELKLFGEMIKIKC